MQGNVEARFSAVFIRLTNRPSPAGRCIAIDDRYAFSLAPVTCSIIQPSMSCSMCWVISSPQGYWRKVAFRPAAWNNRSSSQVVASE
jgi:hypothetical protein